MVEEIDRPPTLTIVASDSVRNAIFRGDLKPGEPLREGDLSQSLGVSRSTVREALRLLQEDGLVEVIPHRGAFVTRIFPRMVDEIYTLRILLEPYVVRSALQEGLYSQEHLNRLEVLVRQMGEFEERGDVFSTVKMDQEFHQLLCEPSELRLFLDVLKSVGFLSRLCMINIKLYSADLIADEEQHRQVLEAVRQGDPEHAADVLRKHLTAARDALLARMQEADWENFNG
jgi:DNA-binding GntR family transcriptional regulator